METRSIALGLIAIVAAFAVAFGAGKATSGKTAAAGAGVRAEAIKVAAPPAVQGVEVGGVMPGLKSSARKPATKKKTKKAATKSPTASAPSTNNTTSSTPAPSRPSTPLAPAGPTTPSKPSKPSTPSPGPITGGGDDG